MRRIVVIELVHLDARAVAGAVVLDGDRLTWVQAAESTIPTHRPRLYRCAASDLGREIESVIGTRSALFDDSKFYVQSYARLFVDEVVFHEIEIPAGADLIGYAAMTAIPSTAAARARSAAYAPDTWGDALRRQDLGR